jgi:hypothetical protein
LASFAFAILAFAGRGFPFFEVTIGDLRFVFLRVAVLMSLTLPSSFALRDIDRR